MRVRTLRFVSVPLVLVLLAPLAGAKEYIRDEVRVNMRSGPSSEYRILRLLVSGDAVTQIGEDDGWVQIQADDGEKGWVPKSYVSSDAPASVTLPRSLAQLEKSKEQVAKLEEQLATQTEAIKEIDYLRMRNEELEKSNKRLYWSDSWKKWATGAVIAGIFLLIGGTLPKGGARSRRIKI